MHAPTRGCHWQPHCIREYGHKTAGWQRPSCGSAGNTAAPYQVPQHAAYPPAAAHTTPNTQALVEFARGLRKLRNRVRHALLMRGGVVRGEHLGRVYANATGGRSLLADLRSLGVTQAHMADDATVAVLPDIVEMRDSYPREVALRACAARPLCDAASGTCPYGAACDMQHVYEDSDAEDGHQATRHEPAHAAQRQADEAAAGATAKTSDKAHVTQHCAVTAASEGMSPAASTGNSSSPSTAWAPSTATPNAAHAAAPQSDPRLHLLALRVYRTLKSHDGRLPGSMVPAAYRAVTGHELKEDLRVLGQPVNKTMKVLPVVVPQVCTFMLDGGAGVLCLRPTAGLWLRDVLPSHPPQAARVQAACVREAGRDAADAVAPSTSQAAAAGRPTATAGPTVTATVTAASDASASGSVAASQTAHSAAEADAVEIANLAPALARAIATAEQHAQRLRQQEQSFAQLVSAADCDTAALAEAVDELGKQADMTREAQAEEKRLRAQWKRLRQLAELAEQMEALRA